MKEIIKKILVVASIMLIALGGCVSCASDEDWWLCLIPAAIGILILLSIYISEKIKNNKRRKQNGKIIIDGRHIKIDFNNHSVLSSILPFFSVSSVDTGVNISYTLTKYVSLLKNIEEMLKTVNYKIQIRCSNEKVEISAVPIIDFSDEIELSQDYQLDFNFDDKRNGVNHLICVGKDENKQELIVNLYSDTNGNISKTQNIFGTDKIDSFYESSKSTLSEIEEEGIEKFKELISKKTFEMDVANISLPNIEIGDIVGGRDYLTGQTIKKPITGKILMINDDVLSLEFKIEGEGE